MRDFTKADIFNHLTPERINDFGQFQNCLSKNPTESYLGMDPRSNQKESYSFYARCTADHPPQSCLKFKIKDKVAAKLIDVWKVNLSSLIHFEYLLLELVAQLLEYEDMDQQIKGDSIWAFRLGTSIQSGYSAPECFVLNLYCKRQALFNRILKVWLIPKND